MDFNSRISSCTSKNSSYTYFFTRKRKKKWCKWVLREKRNSATEPKGANPSGLLRYLCVIFFYSQKKMEQRTGTSLSIGACWVFTYFNIDKPLIMTQEKKNSLFLGILGSSLERSFFFNIDKPLIIIKSQLYVTF